MLKLKLHWTDVLLSVLASSCTQLLNCNHSTAASSAAGRCDRHLCWQRWQPLRNCSQEVHQHFITELWLKHTLFTFFHSVTICEIFISRLSDTSRNNKARMLQLKHIRLDVCWHNCRYLSLRKLRFNIYSSICNVIKLCSFHCQTVFQLLICS